MEIPQNITKSLTRAGLAEEDLFFWRGIFDLAPQEYVVLLDFLKSATAEEINCLNELLRKKSDVLRSGDPNLLNELVDFEKNLFQTP